MNFNECNECTICCDGYLIGSAYNHKFGNLNKCHFMNGTCSIYNIRPPACRKYFCAWKQKLFPDFMRPDLCKTLISVELNNNKQCLKVISIDTPSPEVLNEITKFQKENECEVLYVRACN